MDAAAGRLARHGLCYQEAVAYQDRLSGIRDYSTVPQGYGDGLAVAL